MSVRILAVSFLFCATLAAQTCPDRVVRHVEGRTTIGTIMQCKDASSVWRPVGSTVNLAGCPSIVVVYPGHDTPDSRPGSGTYVEFVRHYEVRQYVFSCETDYFLFIPLVTNCRLVDRRTIAFRNDYIERLCPLAVEEVDTAVTEN